MTDPNAPPVARPEYYAFAHVVMRRAALGEPARFAEAVAADDRVYFRALWGRALGEVARAGRAPEVPPGAPPDGPVGQLRLTGYAHEPATVALVELPPPEGVPEAWAVALGRASADSPPRYFALERSGEPGTWVLAEWAADGRHLNLGAAAASGVRSFLEAVFERLVPPGQRRRA